MSEQSRLIPTTYPVSGHLEDASKRLVAQVADAAAGAEIAPVTAGNGTTWQYGGETITYLVGDKPTAVRHITAANDMGSEFKILTEDGATHPVEFTADGEMAGEHFDAFRLTRDAIFAGSAIGSHEFFMAKGYNSGNDADGEAVVQAILAHNSKGDGSEPSVAVDLHFLRSSPRVASQYGDSTVIQTTRIESDLSTNTTRVGHGTTVDMYLEVPGTRNEQTGEAQFIPVPDSDPQRTAGAMQSLYQPETPLDEWPTVGTWQRLVARPIGHGEILPATA